MQKKKPISAPLLLGKYALPFATLEFPRPVRRTNIFFAISGFIFTIIALGLLQFFPFLSFTNFTGIYFLLVTYAAYSGGGIAGIGSSILIILYAIYTLSVTRGGIGNFYPMDVSRIAILGASFIVIATVISLLKSRTKTLVVEQQAREEAEATANLIAQLQAVTDITLRQLTLPQLLHTVTRRIRQLLSVDTAIILLKDKKRNILIPMSSRGIEDGIKTKIHVPVGKGFAGRIAAERRPLALEAVKKSDVVDPFIVKRGVQSLLGVPLLVGGKVIGVLHVGTVTKRHFSRQDMQLLQLVADRIALAIDRAEHFEKAKEAVRMRDEFLSITSHELKTPLTSMLLQLQGVLHSVRRESLANFSIEKMLTRLESAEQQSKRLSQLVNDLVNVSLISSGRFTLEPEEVDLSTIVKDVVNRFDEQAAAMKTPITLRLDKGVKGLWDKLRIEQVVINLLSNAMKYGKGKPIEVVVTKDTAKAIISVTDHGIGIKPEVSERIFNRFDRGTVSTREYKGLGVGLYVTKQILAAHKGRISVVSKQGKGTTFTVELPILSKEMAQKPNGKKETNRNSQKPTK